MSYQLAARLIALLMMGVGAGLVWAVFVRVPTAPLRLQLRRAAWSAVSGLICAALVALLFLDWLLLP